MKFRDESSGMKAVAEAFEAAAEKVEAMRAELPEFPEELDCLCNYYRDDVTPEDLSNTIARCLDEIAKKALSSGSLQDISPQRDKS